MSIEYKLNIIKEYKSNGDIRLGNNIKICNESYLYITTQQSIQKAYEKCTTCDWLIYLIDVLQIEELSYDDYIENKEDNYYKRKGVYSLSLPSNKSNSLYNRWNREYVKLVKKELPWNRLKDILLSKNLIKEIKYELNIFSGPHYECYEDHVILKNNFYICKPAYEYIQHYDTLREAYEKCQDVLWLQYLLRSLNLSFVTIDEFIRNKIINTPYFSHNPVWKQLQLEGHWRYEWASMIKKEYTWSKIKKCLLILNLIKEKE